MAQYGNSKNPPWARSGCNQQVGSHMGSAGNLSQSMLAGNMANNQLLQQYSQAQMFPNQMGFQNQVYAGNVGMNAVSYPTRNQLNSAAFHNSSSSVPNSRSSGNMNDGQKQRVFTGTVTKLQDNFGIVDEDVFFQASCCVKGSSPQIGDRVLVEAIYNAAMPFKWNATRIQVLPNLNQGQDDGKMDMDGGGSRFSGGGSRFSGGKQNRNRNNPAMNRKPPMDDRKRAMQNKDKIGDKKRDRSRDKSPDRSRDRTKSERSLSRSPFRDRKRSRSPLRPTKRRRVAPRYSVVVPKFSVHSVESDVGDIKRKYLNMYVPSDFILTKSSWINSFPMDKPFSLDFPCKFHVFPKEVDSIGQKPPSEPSDVDYLFCAKVVLMSSPGVEELFTKCLGDCRAGSQDRDGSDSGASTSSVSLSRVVSFLVGQRGKEPMAIGGPWSPSADGSDPEADPGVLVRTAIRTCRSLTGIDLSHCTQWYRFLEIYYHRGETVHKGKTMPARVETVVLFVPDVWSCLPTRDEWTTLQESYLSQLNRKLAGTDSQPEETKDEEILDEEIEGPKRQPTHHSELDPKTIQMSDLKEELVARNLSPRGLKNQLIARLTKALKTEAEDEEKKKKEEEKKKTDDEKKKDDEDKKKKDKDKVQTETKKEEDKKMDEKEKLILERKYRLPDVPHVLVHPDRTAKSGRFDCAVVSLSSLMNYRIEDNKEHSFEMFLFAETFHCMLVRDFGVRILNALNEAPEKKEAPQEKEKKKESGKEAKDKDQPEKKKDSTDVEEIEDDDEENESGKDKDAASKEEKKDDQLEESKKVLVVDKDLLLAFVYFDSTRCGYFLEKDLEELLSALGLILSRSQIRKLIQKVSEKDSIYYRKLTDKPVVEIEAAKKNEENDDEDSLEFQQNRELMPSFDNEEQSGKTNKDSTLSSGFINYKGKLIDIAKLLIQLDRNELSRASTEKVYNDLYKDYNHLKEKYHKSTDTVSELNDDLLHYKSKLTMANTDIMNMQNKIGRYTNVIFQIRNFIDPIIHENTPVHDDKGSSSSKSKKSTDHRSDASSRVKQEDVKVKDEPSESKASSEKSLVEKSARNDSDEVMEVLDSESENADSQQKSNAKTSGKAAVKSSAGSEDAAAKKQDDFKSTDKKPSETDTATNLEPATDSQVVESAEADQLKTDDDVESKSIDEKTPEKEETEAENDASKDEELKSEDDKDTEEESPKKRRRGNIPTPKRATPASRRSARK